MMIIKAQLHQKASFVAFYALNKQRHREYLATIPCLTKDRIGLNPQSETINKTKKIWYTDRPKAIRTARS